MLTHSANVKAGVGEWKTISDELMMTTEWEDVLCLLVCTLPAQ